MTSLNVTRATEQVAQAKKLIADKNALLRLERNPDYQRLILDEYLVKEPARLMGFSTASGLSAEDREEVIHNARASGFLKNYLAAIITMGNIAERDLPQLEEAIIDIQREEDEAAADNSGQVS